MKSAAQENIAKLPAQCFGILPSSGEIIRIDAGEIGYHKVNQPTLPSYETKEQFVNRVNAEDGISPAIRAAMESGSMFGWEALSANPDIYYSDGSLNRKAFEDEARRRSLNRTTKAAK